MNPTHTAASWLAGLVPAQAPEWLTGIAIFAGIAAPLMAPILIIALLGWLLERRGT